MIQKITKEFEIKDITKHWIMNKVLIWFLLGIGVSLSLGFCYKVMNPKVEKEYVVIVDTVDMNKLDTFMIKAECTELNVLLLMHKLDFTHPYESAAQMIFETSYDGKPFNSPLFRSHHNTGGWANLKGPLYFSHWTDAVRFTKTWQKSFNLKKGMNFYQWLNKTPYHEDDNHHYNSSTILIERALRNKYPLKTILIKLKETK